VNELIDQLVKAAGGTDAAHPPTEIVSRLSLALLIGWAVALVYRRTYTGIRFTNSIFHTQVLLALGGAMIWLVVGDNLVRAFGLAGMIGLIRYRTRIRDPKDTTVLLFSMILGMACGLGQYVVAGIGTGFVFIGLVLTFLFDRRGRARAILRQENLRGLLSESDKDDKTESGPR
jgi:hypothetical protein